jgi:leucine dehydrogenase
VATFEDLLEEWDGEQAVIHRDRESGGWIFICMHSTQLGPAAGGTRLKVYDTPADGLQDAMRLSAGMTAKLAVADLGLGGGKAVLAMPMIPEGDDRRALLHRYGDIVASLRGSFITSSDVGTGESDMDVIAERTEHVFGRSVAKGGAGDPGPFTAVGVFHGIKASLAHVYGSDDLSGRTVLVQGVGSVGAALAELLGRDGAVVFVADVDAERARWIASAVGGSAVEARAAIATECDVYAPCARCDAERGQHPATPLPDRRRVREQPACPTGSSRASPRRRSPLCAGLRHQRRRRDRDQLPRAQCSEPGRR